MRVYSSGYTHPHPHVHAHLLTAFAALEKQYGAGGFTDGYVRDPFDPTERRFYMSRMPELDTLKDVDDLPISGMIIVKRVN